MSSKKPVLAVETSSRVGSVALADGPDLIEERSFSAPLKHSAEIFPTIAGLLERHNLTPAHIEQLYISIGPGSFTGLRIAVAMAKTMALATPVKIVTVDTLDTIAANIIDLLGKPSSAKTALDALQQCVAVAPLLDAKRGQFFTALYRPAATAGNGPEQKNAKNSKVPKSSGYTDSAPRNWTRTTPDLLLRADEIVERFTAVDQPLLLLGDGLLYHMKKFQSANVRFAREGLWPPKASGVHKLGWDKASRGVFADPLSLEPNYLRRPEAEEKWNARNKPTV